ncbi:MAG: YlxM family DNA-binding protein, partial [Firmicutes bacterium]|nr:YlxM family DNA-binding protein [Bacillota bacterium]
MARRPGHGENRLEERLQKTVEMALLYDRYGELLTERQRRFFELYFLDDLSLGEISDQYGVSRQAVYDILRRSQRTLEKMERILGLVAARRAQAEHL